MKFLGAYTVPKVDVQIGASYQNVPGIEISANYAVINSDVARPKDQGGLGRLPGSAVSATATTTVALVPSQTQVLRPAESARPSSGEDTQARPDPGEREPRPLQPVQQGDHQRRERDVRDVAGAELGHFATTDEGLTDTRLLARPAGWGAAAPAPRRVRHCRV